MIKKLTNQIESIKGLLYEKSPSVEMIAEKLNEVIGEVNRAEKERQLAGEIIKKIITKI